MYAGYKEEQATQCCKPRYVPLHTTQIRANTPHDLVVVPAHFHNVHTLILLWIRIYRCTLFSRTQYYRQVFGVHTTI